MKRASSIKRLRNEVGTDLARLYSGELTDRELKGIRERHTFDSAYGEELEGMAEILADMDGLASSENIQHILSEPVNTKGSRQLSVSRMSWFAAAACLVLAMAIVFTNFVVNWQGVEHLDSDRYLTRVGEQRLVKLEDGTRVHMNTNTELLVTYSGSKREITLKRGEAYFEVNAEPDRPFSVAVNNQQVTVLGTAFNLHKMLDQFQLLVVAGQVALHQEGSPLGSLLEPRTGDDGYSVSNNLQYRVTPGWAVEFAGSQRQMTFHKVANVDDAVAWSTGLLSFDGTPLYEVVKELNRYSPLKILIEDHELVDMKVHAAIKVNNLRVALDGIASAQDIKVDYYSDRIVLTKN